MSYGSYKPRGFGGFGLFPPIIKNLLIINGGIFFLSLLGQSFTIDGISLHGWIRYYFALWPLGFDLFGVWQLISYQFLHANFMHILFNMFVLWMFGMEIENQLGSRKFLIYYLLCGIGAGLLHLLFSPSTGNPIPTVGASGSIYGVLIAFALFNPNRLIYIYFLIPVKAKYLVGFLIIFEFLAVENAASQVAHLAHLGGAITGFIFLMFDSSVHFGLKNMFRSAKWKQDNNYSSWDDDTTDSQSQSQSSVFDVFRKGSSKKKTTSNADIEDAEYYEIKDEKKQDDTISQEEIDRILDKISQSGYKNLTEREKRILFEASKRMK